MPTQREKDIDACMKAIQRRQLIRDWTMTILGAAFIFLLVYLWSLIYGSPNADAQTMIDTASNVPVSDAQLPNTIDVPTLKVNGVAVNASASLGVNVGKALLYNGLLYRNNGNIGVGNSSPAYLLDVSGSLHVSGYGSKRIIIDNINDYHSGYWAQFGSGDVWNFAPSSGDDLTFSYYDGSWHDSVTFTDAGAVGIGIVPNYFISAYNSGTGASNHSIMQFITGDSGSTAADGCFIGFHADANAYFYNFENTNMYFATNNLSRAFIQNDGLFDLDPNSNTFSLRIHGVDYPNEIANIFVDAQGALVLSSVGSTDNASYIDLLSEDNEYGIIIRQSNGVSASTFGNIYVTDAADDYMTFDLNSVKTGDLTLTASGKVGINTIAPAETLEVSGTLKVSGADFILSGGAVTTSGADIIQTFTSSGTLNVTGSGNVQVLVIAGGGGGGMDISGGGGYQYNASYAVTTGNYTVTIGTGGTGEISSGASKGDDGTNSVFGTITATGGGGGGSGGNRNGANGGSGGGGADNAGQGLGGTGSQGSNGGNAEVDGSSGGGGGGGNTAVGMNASGDNGGNGGAGTSNSISGSAVVYAGGGGGSARTSASTGGTGGSGGGGRGAGSAGVSVAGTANTGGGGGGGSGTGGQQTGANGGSGIVIVRYTPANTRMLVTGAGVGIATGTISARLEVKGNIFASGSITSNSLRSAKTDIVLITPDTRKAIINSANSLSSKISRWKWRLPEEYRKPRSIFTLSDFHDLWKIEEATKIESITTILSVTTIIKSVTGEDILASELVPVSVTREITYSSPTIILRTASDLYEEWQQKEQKFKEEKIKVSKSKNYTTPRFGVTIDDMLELAKVNPELAPFLQSMIVYSEDENQPRLGHGESIQALLALILIQQERLDNLEARIKVLETR